MTVPEAKALLAIQLLIEGTSIRSVERITRLHRDTIIRLLVLPANAAQPDGCSIAESAVFQSDEIWTFVAKKQRRLREDDPEEFGDAWVFVALDGNTKLIPSFAVGKRDTATTNAFIGDLKQRLAKRIQLTTDGFRFYVDAMEEHFGADIDFGQVVKLYGDYGQLDAAARYSPGPIMEVIVKVFIGTVTQGRARARGFRRAWQQSRCLLTGGDAFAQVHRYRNVGKV